MSRSAHARSLAGTRSGVAVLVLAATRSRVAVLALAGGLLALACEPTETKLGAARLAEADGTIPDPGAGTPTVELVPGKPAPSSPAGPPATLRLAIDRDVTWGEVRRFRDAVERAGGKVVPVVAGRRGKLAALPPDDPAVAESILLVAQADGKACVSPPGEPEATCVARLEGKRVDRAFVRELVRKAVQTYELTHVHVVLAPDLSWGDAVRALDGARTCCGDRRIAVSVE